MKSSTYIFIKNDAFKIIPRNKNVKSLLTNQLNETRKYKKQLFIKHLHTRFDEEVSKQS